MLSPKFTKWTALPLDQDDKGEPMEGAPAFQSRYPTGEQSSLLVAAIDAADLSWSDWRKGVVTALRWLIVGWRNIPAEADIGVELFDADKLPKILTDGELRELGEEIIKLGRVGSVLLKKSKSPAGSVAGGSGAPVGDGVGSPKEGGVAESTPSVR